MRDYKPVNPQSQRNKEGILHRLFNYVVNSLFSRHQEFDDDRKPMMGASVVDVPSKYVEIQGNGPSSKSKVRSSGSSLSSEIEIEFRHTEIEPEKWNNAFQKDVNGIDRENNGAQIRKNGQNFEKITNGQSQAPVARKTVDIKGAAGNSHASSKLKNIDGVMKRTHSGNSGDNSNHTSAIEEFLKSRKEAMRRYYSMDHKENH